MEKYACIKGMKNEPLSHLVADLKKRKLSDEKGDTVVLLSVQITLSSPTLSLEVTAFTPPTTLLKGKGKVGKRIWDDPATALGRAHNVVTDDELKSLTSLPSHELVSRHIHKLVQVYSFPSIASFLYTHTHTHTHTHTYILQLSSHSSQVLGDSLCLMMDYLNTEEKVMVANSKLEYVEAESSKLRKDLIIAMDETNKENEKIKELSEAL